MLFYLIYSLWMGHALFMLIAMASILIHEAAHAGTSIMFGYAPESIELSPLGAVMRMEDDRQLPPFKRGIMVLAGPIVTFGICSAAIAAAKADFYSTSYVSLVFMANLSILMINLLPVLPLDGGRLLSLILEPILKPRIAGRVMHGIGVISGVMLVVLSIWSAYHLGSWNLSLAFTGCCLIYCASASTMTRAMAELRFLMDRKIYLERTGIRIAKCKLALHNQTLRQLIQSIPAHRLIQYTIIEAGTMKTLGILTEFDVISAYLKEPNMICGKLLFLKEQESGKI